MTPAPFTSLNERVGVAHALGLIVATMVCVAGLALIIGAVGLAIGAAGQFVWTALAAVLGFEVRL